MDKLIYQRISSLIDAYIRNIETGNTEWELKHKASIDALLEEFPSGSGFDNGTKLDFQKSTPENLIFYTSFHHMNENGYYDGWTEHTITIKPSLQFGYRLVISGKDRNDIKEYIHETFSFALDKILKSEEINHVR